MRWLSYFSVIVMLTGILFCTEVQAQRRKQPKEYSIKFSVTPSYMSCPGWVSLRWETEGADSVRIEGLPGKYGINGEQRLWLENSAIFTLQAWLPSGKTVSRTKEIAIFRELPEIERVDYPRSPQPKKSFPFTWTTRGAAKVRIYGISGLPDSLPPNSTVQLQLDHPTRFTLVAYNSCGDSVLRSGQIGITYGTEISYPSRVTAGYPCRIRWDFAYTSEVEIRNHPGRYAAHDSLVCYPWSDTAFVFLVHRKDGVTDSVRTSTRVNSDLIQLLDGPPFVFKGNTATIRWNAPLADRVEIRGMPPGKGPLPLTGNLSLRLDSAMEFTLVAHRGPLMDMRTIFVNCVARSYVRKIIPYTQLAPGLRVDAEIFRVERSSFPDEIRLHVVVVDSLGNFISGLAPDKPGGAPLPDIFGKLFEDDGNGFHPIAKYTIREVREDMTPPNDISLTLDYSGSMLGNITMLEKGVRKFIDMKAPHDRIAITKFDDSLAVVQPLSEQKKDLLNKSHYKGLTDWGGSTALYAGGDMGLSAFTSDSAYKTMILFTDGMENSSMNYLGKYSVSASELSRHARRRNVTVNVVSFGTGVNALLLHHLAEINDGKYYRIYDTDEIMLALNELPIIMHHYYEISYKPLKRSRGNHTVRLEYNNQAGQTGETSRKIYMDDADADLDGMENEQMRYIPSTFKNLHSLGPPQVAAQFDFNEAEVKPQFFPLLDKAAEYLLSHPRAQIHIYGHTDLVGSDLDCMRLSEERIGHVVGYLHDKGVDTRRIVRFPCGKKHPLWPLEDQEWKAAENRRIEIVLYDE